MIRYIENENIDRDAWDSAVACCETPLIYAMSWHLDIVAPGWCGFVEDDYSHVMPLVHRKKSGFHYLYQPPFSQQLGVFGQHVSADTVKAFLQATGQRFRFAEIMLNESNTTDISGIEKYTNIVLPLNRNIEEIRSGYNENTRRNIRKAAQNNVILHKGFDIENIATLFKQNKGEAFGKKDSWYSVLKTLAYQMRHLGLAATYSALNNHNEIIAGILTLEFNGRVVLLFSGSGPEARETGAMHFLIDSILEEKCLSAHTFDFEGSNNENLARFYMGFGGTKKDYPFVRINRLPLCVRWMKKKGIGLF